MSRVRHISSFPSYFSFQETVMELTNAAQNALGSFLQPMTLENGDLAGPVCPGGCTDCPTKECYLNVKPVSLKSFLNLLSTTKGARTALWNLILDFVATPHDFLVKSCPRPLPWPFSSRRPFSPSSLETMDQEPSMLNDAARWHAREFISLAVNALAQADSRSAHAVKRDLMRIQVRSNLKTQIEGDNCLTT